MDHITVYKKYPILEHRFGAYYGLSMGGQQHQITTTQYQVKEQYFRTLEEAQKYVDILLSNEKFNEKFQEFIE